MPETVVAPPAAPAKPLLPSLSVSSRKVSLSGRMVGGRCVKPNAHNNASNRCRLPIKLKVSYTLAAAATLTITLKRQSTGRKVNGRCVAPTKANQSKAECMRLVSVPGQLTETATAGSDTFTFNGKLSGKTLGPGTYRLTATPRAADRAGTPSSVTFTIDA